jgi:chloramphenicol 3-O-phosphotransferase
MTILLLTGPPASGKTTIAASMASRDTGSLAIIEVDDVRAMIVQPHSAPWDGDEGQRQQFLSVRNASVLAQNFDISGFDVLIIDAITNETAARYREELALVIVRLLPNWEQTMIRSQSRDEPLRFRERELLYEQQTALADIDLTIDNSSLAPDVAAGQLQRLFRNPPPTPAPQPRTGYHAIPNPLPPPAEGVS